FGSGEAYLPVLEAVGRLCRDADGERLTSLLATHAPTWLAQLPSLRPGADTDPLAATAPGVTAARMLRQMSETFQALTADTVLVLLLEDLHWSDYSTVDLVSALARRRHPARLLLLATYRPVETVLSAHPLRTVKRDLQARRLCHELPLGLLNEAAVAEYLAGRFPGGGLPASLARLLHQRTEGHPLFLVNVVDYWLAKGLLTPSRQPNAEDKGGASRGKDSGWELKADLCALEIG